MWQDWIRGKVPFFVRPPDLPPSDKPTPAKPTKAGFEIDKTASIKGVQQPLHQIVHSNKFLADDEQKLDPVETAAEVDVVADDLDVELNDEEEEEWTGFGSAEEDDEEALTWEEVMGLEESKSEAPADEEEIEEEIDDMIDDVFGDSDQEQSDEVDIVIDAPQKSLPANDLKLSKNKRGSWSCHSCFEVSMTIPTARFAQDEASDDEDAAGEPSKKEARMTTNKKKSANFYTDAK